MVHDGRLDEEDEEEAAAAGREGKADEGGGRTAGAEVHVAADLVLGTGPPKRTVFFSLSTRLECFCDGAAVGMAGFAAAALAQPLELEVAPCMPLKPGKLG